MDSSTETAQGTALARFLRHHFPATDSGDILAIRPHSAAALHDFRREKTRCLQTNRLLADALEQCGYPVVTEISGDFDICLVEATKYKDENLFHIALAWSVLRPGGHLLVSAANTLGAESLGRRIRQAGVPILEAHSYAKCRVLWIRRDAASNSPETFAEWLALGQYRVIPGTDLVTAAGVFSAGGIDAGTRVLSASLPAPLHGRGADFGAGYGALAHHILSRSEHVRRLDLFDIERNALAAAERNLAPWRERVDLRYEWADVQRLPPGPRYDWIVMNPPFHSGRAAVPALGKAFIRTAAVHLEADGCLWLVANRHLPYEAILAECFGEVVPIVDKEGFKVCRARRPKRFRGS